MASYEECRRLITSNIQVSDVIEEVVNKLMLLPSKMIEEFANNDWHIFITKGSIESHYNERESHGSQERIMGLTDWNARVIFIPIIHEWKEEGRTFPAEFATIHEFGHYFDRSKGMPSMSYKFQNIYNEEDIAFCKNVGTASNTTEAVEYYAEAFAAYVLRNQLLREYCPDTYKYFEAVFDEYK